MSLHEDMAEPIPQDYGLAENPKPSQVQVWNRQEMFLAAYAKVGKIGRLLGQ
jgi:hypothetical protein